MKVVFRADASLDIGTGHIMRCLTLAEALREKGVDCQFVCRKHLGNLVGFVRERGFKVSVLPKCEDEEQYLSESDDQLPIHASWLGCDCSTDARQTAEVLKQQKPDWLVVDHYALSRAWEIRQRNHAGRILVIDDLADRLHDCDLLLDQNLGRKENDYATLVPQNCHILTGPLYALLRPEFAALREYSLKRRKDPKISNILISMGGVDQHNATSRVLDSLKNCQLPDDCTISVVLGQNTPWLDLIQKQALTLPWHTEVLVNIGDMAQQMADSDLAIGGAGTTSWERCCLGLPAFIMILADNQRSGAEALGKLGGACVVGDMETLFANVDDEMLESLIQVSASVTDGQGVHRVASHIFEDRRGQWRIRPVVRKDELLLLEMANDKLTRQNAFNPDPISKSTHHDWFENRISKLDFCRIYIIESLDSNPLGQVRFERISKGLWEIGFSILPPYRGAGLGLTVLRLALNEFQKNYQGVTVVGKVKQVNKPSTRIFEALGFDGVTDEENGIRVFQKQLGQARWIQ